MPPKSSLRACLVCSILMPMRDFVEIGCPNCEDVVHMKGSGERVNECTSTIYDGMIALIQPEESWVGRWQRIDKKEKGFYAVRVTGTPPSDVIEGIAAHGGVWRPRDTIDEL